MGTNFYRIPTVEEMEERRVRLQRRIEKMELTASNVERGFNTIEVEDWEFDNPWSEFTKDTSVHLGKRSGGWRFCWNFHNNKFYSSKQELIDFVKSGRVVDEYGQELEVNYFLDMAFNWCPDGLIANREYFNKNENYRSWMTDPSKYYDLEVDGLRVSSSVEFS